MALRKLDGVQEQLEGCQIVEMNSVGYLHFQQEDRIYIVTHDLNGCTAVVIVSKDAAILAHISPRPSEANPDQATGDAHVKTKMKQVWTLLGQHLNDFREEGTGGLIVSAVLSGKVCLEDQKNIIEAEFRARKLRFQSVSYPILNKGEYCPSGKGTVLVDASGEMPIVWVEDKPIARMQGNQIMNSVYSVRT